MTNEEAREAIKFGHCDDIYYRKEYEEAVNMAIKALEQQPCEDCVSRQALIEKATSWDKHFADSERCVSLTDIQNAPSITPQPKRGQWIKANGEENLAIWTCDQCGCKIYSETEYDRKKFHAWCGKCGCKMEVDMREVQDER